MLFKDGILMYMMSAFMFLFILSLMSVSGVCAFRYCDVDGYNQTYCYYGCCGPDYHQWCCKEFKNPFKILDAVLMTFVVMMTAASVYAIGFFCIKYKVWTFRCYRDRPYRPVSPAGARKTVRPRDYSALGRTQAPAATPAGQGTQTGGNQTRTQPTPSNKTAGNTKPNPKPPIQRVPNPIISPPQPKKDGNQDEKLLQI